MAHGFGKLARSDFSRAKELFEAGTRVWAFDPNALELGLKDDRVSEEMRKWLLVGLVAVDS